MTVESPVFHSHPLSVALLKSMKMLEPPYILAVEVSGRLPLRCQNGNAGLAPAARSPGCEDGPARGAGLAERMTEEVLSWWGG